MSNKKQPKKERLCVLSVNQALALKALPAVGAKGGADHVDVMAGLGGDAEVRVDIAAVQHVRAGEAIAIVEALVDDGARDTIRRGRRGGHDLGDEGRAVGIAFWASREIAERYRSMRSEFRERALSIAGVRIEEVVDYDVAFARFGPGLVAHAT